MLSNGSRGTEMAQRQAFIRNMDNYQVKTFSLLMDKFLTMRNYQLTEEQLRSLSKHLKEFTDLKSNSGVGVRKKMRIINGIRPRVWKKVLLICRYI